MTEEELSSTITTTTMNNNNNNKSSVDDNIVDQPQPVVKEKKKHGAFSFLRAASLKLRRRRSLDLKQQKFSLDLKQQKFSQDGEPVADSKGENWKKLVGSMRPLHLQDNQSPPNPRPPVKSPSMPAEFFEQFSSPYSVSPSSSSAGTMSQYASANNLQELCGERNDEEEEEDPDQAFDAYGADDMIDAKAENFIAQFYEQMRLQQ
ncbi:hypothetical protein P3S67_001557 [Capsicum chacoense]